MKGILGNARVIHPVPHGVSQANVFAAGGDRNQRRHGLAAFKDTLVLLARLVQIGKERVGIRKLIGQAIHQSLNVQPLDNRGTIGEMMIARTRLPLIVFMAPGWSTAIIVVVYIISVARVATAMSSGIAVVAVIDIIVNRGFPIPTTIGVETAIVAVAASSIGSMSDGIEFLVAMRRPFFVSALEMIERFGRVAIRTGARHILLAVIGFANHNGIRSRSRAVVIVDVVGTITIAFFFFHFAFDIIPVLLLESCRSGGGVDMIVVIVQLRLVLILSLVFFSFYRLAPKVVVVVFSFHGVVEFSAIIIGTKIKTTMMIITTIMIQIMRIVGVFICVSALVCLVFLGGGGRNIK